jgi:cysteine desulfurase/selenocysteine lyase
MKQFFPLFQNNPGLVYLDYANTTPKPASVIEAITQYYSEYSGNVHRANHDIGSRADAEYERSRHAIAEFIGADSREIVFQKNTTEAINLVAHSYVLPRLKPGDKILCTGLEHHANLVSWQLIAEKVGAEVIFSRVAKNGLFDYEHWRSLLNPGVSFAAFTAVSNVTGETLPFQQMLKDAHLLGITTMLDGAQLVPHQRINVHELDVDFLAFSGHKVYGPTGLGILYGRYELLEKMTPFLGGGDMIETVRYSGATYQAPPMRFEAGTPPIASVIGLGKAVDFVAEHLTPKEDEHADALVNRAIEGLKEIPGLQMMGSPDSNSRLVTFTVEGVHSADLGAYLNEKGVAVRVGKMCAHPLLENCGIDSAVRASFGLPTDENDVEMLLSATRKAVELFR